MISVPKIKYTLIKLNMILQTNYLLLPLHNLPDRSCNDFVNYVSQKVVPDSD